MEVGSSGGGPVLAFLPHGHRHKSGDGGNRRHRNPPSLGVPLIKDAPPVVKRRLCQTFAVQNARTVRTLPFMPPQHSPPELLPF